MAKPSEEISKYNANKNGKTDANLANDSNHLGGVPADDFATKKYVRDYHENKEELLKQYIDNQDDNTLDEAKSYTDTAIRNQDFSDFLKSSDKVALQNQISQCGENCANNLNLTKTEINNRINGIVTDVNSNFSDVNGAITNLNNTTQNLFTSVSNGKSQVASAITDKGVSTASDASFATMANNIRNIPTDGGGGGGGSGEDTSDATATSNTLFAGYTAYARGQKILGTYIPPFEREQDGIIYINSGIDTSDATATAADIAIGKTAYVNGNKIIGTCKQVTDTSSEGYNTSTVETQDDVPEEITEYYGASMNAYNIRKSTLLAGNTRLISFTPDNTYSIQMCLNDGTSTVQPGSGLFDYKIVTHRIVDGEQVYTTSVHATSSEIDKYEWTKTELGLTDNEVVVDMILSSPGVMGREDLCWLIIQVDNYVPGNNDNYTADHYWNGYKFYLYTFNMTKSGVIGKTSSSDSHFVWHREIEIPQATANQSYKILAANLNCNTFMQIEKTGGTGDTRYLYYGYTKISLSTDFNQINGVNVSIVKKLTRLGVSNYSIIVPQLSADDQYITTYAAYSNDGMILSLAEDYNLKGYYLFSSYYRYLYVPTHNKILRFKGTYTGDGNVDIFDGGSASSVTGGSVIEGITSLGTITLPTPNSYPYYLGKYVFLSADYSKIFVSYSSGQYQGNISEDTNRIWIAYNVDDLLHIDENGNLDPIFTEEQRSEILPPTNIISVSRGSEKIVMVNASTGDFLVWNNKIDKGNIIMVKYKNMWFQRLRYGQLTAGQPDVKNGKTFIGWMGYPETGNNTDI